MRQESINFQFFSTATTLAWVSGDNIQGFVAFVARFGKNRVEIYQIAQHREVILMIRTPKFARLYRTIFALIGWSAMFILWYSAAVNRPAGSSALAAAASTFRYFTVQSNLFVLIWLLVAVLYWDRAREHPILRPLVKGAFTVYITVTFVIFATLLQSLVDPQGIDFYVNAITHFVTPIAFIVDWILYERKRAYQWRYALVWLVYPLAYLIFAQSYGSLTGDYLYPFLNLPELGINGLATWVAVLFMVFLVLGVLYIGVNRVWGIEEEIKQGSTNTSAA